MIKTKLILISILFLLPITLYAPIKQYNDIQRIEKIYKTLNKVELELFLSKLHQTESPYSWDTINYLGCIGGYQISVVALEDIGYKGSIEQFRKSKKIQRECLLLLLKRNKQIIEYYKLDTLIGKRINGVNFTLSGMLGAAHLSGVGGIKRFVTESYNSTDGNESVKSYLQKFEDYNLNIL